MQEASIKKTIQLQWDRAVETERQKTQQFKLESAGKAAKFIDENLKQFVKALKNGEAYLPPPKGI